ncbi:MAG TPA: sensor histidine kinase [Methanocella sp.]|nr:sensor histidine kinase [Methanocella sp.]
MGEAKSVSELTTSYVELSENYLRSIADRPSVINAFEDRNQSALNTFASYTAVQSLAFDSAFFTDNSGRVIAYSTMYPNYANRSYPDIVGMNYFDRPYVGQVLRTSNPAVMASGNDIDGSSTVYVGVPIRDLNNTTIGTLVGIYDLGNLTSTVIRTTSTKDQFVYIVNGSGNVIVHPNQSYVKNMANLTLIPAVQNVIQGKSDVIEQYNPIEKDGQLAAYAPINSTGWGVVAYIPTSVAYQPISSLWWVIGALTLILAAIALALAYLFSESLIRPILGLYDAARAITNHGEYAQYLPLKRKDEIGQVAVCMDKMAQRIDQDRARITDEKNRAELYLDIMGHDINNLNQVALTNLDLIKGDENLTEDQNETLSDALNSVKGSAAIIDNVRKIQAIAQEKPSMQPEDLDEIIKECVAEAPKPAEYTVKINYSPRPGSMVMGTTLLKEVFNNLIANAIKHAGRDVTIDIRIDEVVRAGKKFYEVSIADNGPGIPDALKPKLFARFQRGDTKAHGKGLGLFIVKSLVETVGGNVTVEDRVPGDYTQGARFIVSLPASEGYR